MTTGSPPSTTATTELVVPRSIPMTLAMTGSPPLFARLSAQLDLDLARLGFVHLGEAHLQDPVPVHRPHPVGLDRDRQLDVPLEAPRPALDPVVVLFLALVAGDPLAAQRQHLARDGQVHVLLADPRQL